MNAFLIHKWLVAKPLLRLALALAWRALVHDLSKLSKAEHALLYPNKAKTYGDKAYKEFLSTEAVLHHYSCNRHHPEYWDGGIDDMPLVDLIEMIADWRAASERYRPQDANPVQYWRENWVKNVARFHIEYFVERVISKIDSQLQDLVL